MAKIPSINFTVDQLRKAVNRGGAMGGSNEGPLNMSLETRRAMAGGGPTAGLGANPSRSGQPSPKGVGAGLAPNSTPGLLSHAEVRQHNFAIGHARNLMKTGHMKAEHGQAIINRATARLDRHAVAKRQQAVKASMPKPGPSMGSLGGPEQLGLLSSSGQSDIPSGDAVGTTKPIAQQRTSGGRSQIPNSSSGPGRRGGPGYDW
jgi:hypothetical protein